MDSQGLFDPEDSHCKATDALITLFALELSNIHILNVLKEINSTNLEHMKVSLNKLIMQVINKILLLSTVYLFSFTL